MAITQNVSNKKNPVSQNALELAAKGHKAKHERRYSFGMMSIQEDDQRPEFIFDQGMEEQAELNDLKDTVSQFKRIPNALLEKIFISIRIPKRQNIGSSNPTNQEHNHPQIAGPPPPFDIEMLELPDTSPSSVPCSLGFGIKSPKFMINLC